MAFDAGSLDATLELDRSPFQRGLKQARAEGKKFEQTPIKVKLELVDKAARDRLTKFRTSARRPVSAKLDLNDKVARTRLTAFRERAKRNISIRVDLDDKAARTRIAALRAGGGSGALGMANRAISGVAGGFSQALGGIPLVGNVIGAALEGATSAAKFAGEAMTKLLGNFSSLGSVIPGIAGGLTTLVTSLVGLAAVAGVVLIALNAIIGAVIALGGALVALVASLAAAAAGAGLLGVAFLGALGPAVLLGIGLFTRFSAILKARQAQEQALKQAVLSQKTAEQQRTAALEASKAAHQRLTAAYIEGNRAMKRSALDLQDARLSKSEARLGIDQAKRSLRDLLRGAGAGSSLSGLMKQFSDVSFNPADARGAFGKATGGKAIDPLDLREKILTLQRAQLTYKQSVDRVGEAEKTRANFVKKGVEAYGPYAAALSAATKADARLLIARKRTNRATDDYNRQLKKLSGTEKGTLDRVNKLVKGFQSLAKTFSDPVFRAINGVFDGFAGKGDVFRGVLVKLGTAVGDVVKSFGRFLTEPASLSAFKVMGDGAAYLARQLGGRAFVDFLRLIRNLAQAAMPSLKRIAREVGDVFAGWSKKTSNISEFRHNVVIPLVKNFRTWAGLAKDLAGLVIALFKTAAPEGRSLAESLRKIVQHWTAWVNANPAKVRQFFRDAVQKTKDIVKWIKNAVIWLKDHLPKAAEVAMKAFEKVAAVVGTIDRIVNGAGPKLPKSYPKASELKPGEHIDIATGKIVKDKGFEKLRPPSHGAPPPRTPFAGTSAAGDQHFHAHGITDPHQFVAKTARIAGRHPDLQAGQEDEYRRRFGG